MESALMSALAHMRDHPWELEERPTKMVSELQIYMKSDGQGSGNEVKYHEACIAKILENNWFTIVPRGTIPNVDGLYYWYQLQGTQQSGDFFVFEVKNGVKRCERVLDAKHSNGMSIFLNDGTFETGTIYIISFIRLNAVSGQRKKDRESVCFIGLGDDIFNDDERATLAKWRDTLREMNVNKPKTSYLRLYARSANQYDCHRFTPEFITGCWSRLIASLEPSL